MKTRQNVLGADGGNRRGSLLASQGFAEWCQTVIPRGGFFYPHQTTVMDSFLAYLLSSFCSYMLTSATLRVYVVCDVATTSTSNVLATELRDFLYNHRINGACCCFLTTPRVGRGHAEMRFGGNRVKPCLVCKKNSPLIFEYSVPVPYTTRADFYSFLLPCEVNMFYFIVT